MKSKKPDLKEVVGILKSYDSVLYDCRLLPNQLQEFFVYLKTCITQIEAIKTYTVINTGL